MCWWGAGRVRRPRLDVKATPDTPGKQRRGSPLCPGGMRCAFTPCLLTAKGTRETAGVNFRIRGMGLDAATRNDRSLPCQARGEMPQATAGWLHPNRKLNQLSYNFNILDSQKQEVDLFSEPLFQYFHYHSQNVSLHFSKKHSFDCSLEKDDT